MSPYTTAALEPCTTGISNGNGGFTYLYHYVGPGFTFVKLADFTGDGKADLFLYNKANGNTYVGIGDGAGVFNFGPLILSPGYDVNDIGDLNGDRKIDVVLYNSTNGNAATLVSCINGDPNYPSCYQHLYVGLNGFQFNPQLWSPGFTSVAVADYRGNQRADVTVYNKNTAYAYFGAGNGDGTFNFTSLFWSPGYDNVIAEDVDGDGRADVILFNSTTGTEYTGISNGAGAFDYTYALWSIGYKLAKSVPATATALPSSSTLIPFGWTSPAETLMFTGKTPSPYWFFVVIEDASTYSTNGNVNANNACYVEYFAPNTPNNANNYGILRLGGNTYGTYVNPLGTAIGTQGQVSNSQCTLDLSRSWVQLSGSQMQLQLALAFNPSWSGTNRTKEMFVDVGDLGGSQLNWTNRGSWYVPSYGQVPVTTDHYDVFRTGATAHENLLTPNNVSQVQLLGQIPITDGCVWAQPLYVPGVTINSGVHNVLYVATANGKVHAFDADNAWNQGDPMHYGVELWPNGATNLASNGWTVPAPRDADIFACSSSEPVLPPDPIGSPPPRGNSAIIGTPVVDLSTGTMFVAANLQNGTVNPNGSQTQHLLFGLDITNGNIKMGPVPIEDPQNQFLADQELQRAGLLLADYNVLVPFGSYKDNVNCLDIPPTFECPGTYKGYQGWMFNFNRGNLGLLDYANYSPNSNPGHSTFIPGAPIWQSGGGPAFDGSRVYFATGNNQDFVGGSAINGFPVGLSNSILQVNPYGSHSSGPPQTGLQQAAQFLPSQASLPSNQNGWLKGDRDLGSSSVILVPGTNDVTAAGKSGNVYVADRAFPLSGNTSGFSGANGLVYGGAAAWNKSIYLWGGNTNGPTNPEYLKSFSVNGGPAQAQGTVNSIDQEMGAVISISSCYDQNGLVWAVIPDSTLSNRYAPGELMAYNALTLGSPILRTPFPYTNAGQSTSQAANAMKFTAPLVANGRVYVVSMSQEILVYGIPNQSGQTAPACVGQPPQ